MTTRAIFAIHSDCAYAMAAVHEQTGLPAAVTEEHLRSRDQLYERLEYWRERMSKENIDGYVLGIGFIDGWTLIEETQTILPGDIEFLKELSIKCCTTTGGFILQTTSNTFGFIDCRNGQIVRHFEYTNGKVIADVGTLDTEPPPMINDPWNSTAQAWHSMIPSSDPEEFEIRLLTKQTIADSPVSTGAAKSAKKPWWKIF